MVSSHASSLDRTTTSSGKTSSAVSTRQSLVSSSKSSLLDGHNAKAELPSDVSEYAFPSQRLFLSATSALMQGQHELLSVQSGSQYDAGHRHSAAGFFVRAITDLLKYRGVDVSSSPSGSGSLAPSDPPSPLSGPTDLPAVPSTSGAAPTFPVAFRESIQGLVMSCAPRGPLIATNSSPSSDTSPSTHSRSPDSRTGLLAEGPSTPNGATLKTSAHFGTSDDSDDSAKIATEDESDSEWRQIMFFVDLLPSILQDARGFVESELIDDALQQIAVLKRPAAANSLGLSSSHDGAFTRTFEIAPSVVEFPTRETTGSTSVDRSHTPMMTSPTSGYPNPSSSANNVSSPAKLARRPRSPPRRDGVGSTSTNSKIERRRSLPHRGDDNSSGLRSRTNSIISLSLAFTPPRPSTSDLSKASSSSPRSPVTSVHSTQSMIGTFPTRPHTLFSLHSAGSSSISESDSEGRVSPGAYDVLRRKSPLATAEVVTATSPTEDIHFLFTISERQLGRDKGKGRAFEITSEEFEPERSRQMSQFQTSGPKAHDLLAALHARERSSTIAAPPSPLSPPSPSVLTSSASESFLTRARTRATSLHPRALLPSAWRKSQIPTPSSAPAEPDLPPTPSLIITSPSTSPRKLVHFSQAQQQQQQQQKEQDSASLSPTAPRPRRRRSSTQTSPTSSPSTMPFPATKQPESSASGPMPSLHPSLAAVERSSRLLKSTVRCAVCGDVGRDFPRCGRCGEAWCSRECRVESLGGRKRHACGGGPTSAAAGGTGSMSVNGSALVAGAA